jgi:hypothetical protein
LDTDQAGGMKKLDGIRVLAGIAISTSVLMIFIEILAMFDRLFLIDPYT